MKNKFKLLLLSCLLIFTCSFFWQSQEVQAKTSVVTLKPNTTYKKYDITGDKKKDKIVIKSKYDKEADMYGTITVYVNGKSRLKVNGNFYSVLGKIYTLNNGVKLLYLEGSIENGDYRVQAIYKYNSGKFKRLLDFNAQFDDYCFHQSVSNIKVKKNTIHATQYLMSYSTGPTTLSTSYTYKNGKLVRSSNYYKYNNPFYFTTGEPSNKPYTAMKLTAYTKPSAKKVDFRVPKGEKVTILQCYYNGSKMLIQIKYKGKTGWIKAINTKNSHLYQFKNIFYAG